MASYVTDSTTIAFYKFNNANNRALNSISGNQNLLSIDYDLWPVNTHHYTNNKLNYTKGSTISNHKYRSRPSSLTIKYNEENNIYSPILFNLDSGMFPNSLKFDTFTASALNTQTGTEYHITDLIENEWTIDFWFYPNFIRDGSNPIKYCPFLKMYPQSGYSEHRRLVAGYGKDLYAETGNEYIFDISMINFFYSECDDIPYNHYITTASKTNYYLQCEISIYLKNSSRKAETRMIVLIPLDIQTNSWNHISLIKSFEKGLLVSSNGLVTQVIQNYNSTNSKTHVFFSHVSGGTIYFGLTPFNNGTSYLNTVRRTDIKFHLATTRAGYNDPYLSGNSIIAATDQTLLIPANEIQKFTCESYIDDLRFSQAALWTENFVPPGLIGKQIFIYDDYAYYTDPNTGLVTKLSFAKWNDISDNDKVTLLDRVAYNYLPDVDQIKLIQTDPSKDIICLNYQLDTVTPTLNIDKIDQSRSEIVYPTQFMNYSNIQDYIVNITATGSTNNTSIIRLGVTRDGMTYYTYNATNASWVPLDNREDVITNGILINSLQYIPKSAWIQFDLTKFAFAIALTKSYDSDPCKIDDIKLKVNLEDKWVKANKENQVKYKYVGSTMLKITFLENGNYKVIYNDRG